MLFSVVIPVYNSEKTIRRCLDSLIGQADRRAELIVVNDGSKDASDQICSEYAANYPNVVRYLKKENGGVSSARNLGILSARGTFLTFVDSDDYVSPNYFDALEQSLDADLLFFSAQSEKNGQPGSTISCKSLTALNYDQFLLGFVRFRNGSPWNKRFRHTILSDNKILFPTDLSIGEDFVFCLRYLLAASSAAVCDTVLYHVDETNGTSLTRRYNPDFCRQAVTQYQHLGTAVDSSALAPALRAKLFNQLEYNRNRTCFACVKELFKSGKRFYFPLRNEIYETLAAFCEGQFPTTETSMKLKTIKFVIRHKLTFTAYCIAKAQYYRQLLQN